ncbi:MAG: hypothetical protein WA197_17845 [Candidatus Acidiferrales bacterium]
MRIRLAALLLALMAATGLWAQDAKVQDPSESRELNTQAYTQLLRTDLRSKKEQIIKETMQMNEQQAAKFWPIYHEYDAEQTKLGDEKLAIITDYADNFLTMTNEKAAQLAQNVMQLDEKRMALREKYYGILIKSLPAILAVRFFQVENQIQLITDLQIAANLPIIEATDTK